MPNPKMLGSVKVPTHTRKIRGGGSSIVKQYTSLRELNIPDSNISVGDFKKRSEFVRSRLFNEEGKLVIDTNSAEKAVIELYGDIKHNGVDPKELSSENSISTLFTSMKEIFGNTEDPSLVRNFSYVSDEDIGSNILKILTHPDFIDKTIKKCNDLRKSFEDNLDVKTTVIDPFSFKFSSDVVHEVDANMIKDELNKKGIIKELKTLISDNPEHFDSKGWIDFDDLSSRLSLFSRMGLLNNRKAASTYIPTLILDTMAGGIKGSRIGMALSDSLYDNFKPNIEADFITGVPGELRQSLTKVVKESQGVSKEEKSYVLNTLKSIEDKHIIPFVNILRYHDKVSGFLSEKNGIFDSIQKLSERTRGLLEKMTPKHESRDVFISKNPLSILTMSPHNHIPNCQSVCDVAGNLNPGGLLKINIPGTINTHRSNDFIMYTTNDKGEKTARASFNYNQDNNKYSHFEYHPLYGDEQDGLLALSSVMRKKDDLFIKDNSSPKLRYPNTTTEYEKIRTFSKKTEKVAGELHDKIKEALSDIHKNPDRKKIIKSATDLLHSTIDSFQEESDNISANYAKMYSDHISQSLTDYPTFLYGSQMAQYITQLTSRLLDDLFLCKSYYKPFRESIKLLEDIKK